MPYQDCEGCGGEFWSGGYRDYCDNCDSGDYPNFIDYVRHPIGKGPIYYGVELEIEVASGTSEGETSRTILGRPTVENFFGLHDDGSISRGFELVSRPASLDIHREQWEKVLLPRISGLTSESNRTCGLHVHCTREPLTQLQIAKVVYFVNHDYHNEFMFLIARRDPSDWGRIYHKQLKDCNKANGNRYEAVNLQNSRTIEFRLFKGTLNPVKLVASIEFCDSLLAYASPASQSIKKFLSLERYLEFIHLARKRNDGKTRLRWPNLVGYIDAKYLGMNTKLTQRLGLTKEEK